MSDISKFQFLDHFTDQQIPPRHSRDAVSNGHVLKLWRVLRPIIGPRSNWSGIKTRPQHPPVNAVNALTCKMFKPITVLAKEHALFHLTLKTHYEDTFRRHVAPHCLAPHCLVTPHFPVTPHFGAALFGATLFGDATFSCGATFWRRIVWRHIAWRRHIFLWRHILATHCLVTPHFPVTPHFGATFFGDTLFGDATLGGVTLHRWAWSWLEWFRLGVGSAGKNAPGTGCIFGSMVGPHLCRPSKLGWASWHILVLRWAIGKTPNTKCGLWSETIVSGTLLHRFNVFSVFSLYFHYGFTFPLLTFYASYYSTLLVVHFSFHSTRLI